MKLLERGNRLVRVETLRFEYCDLLRQFFRLGKVCLHVGLILLHEHPVALRAARELLHVLHALLGVLPLCHERLQLPFHFLVLL
ncbi:hypothetical protein A2348_02975 [Candidatus Uhrbacteria bacterium RIFOXYB12_FULL_58_10]|uniref:Uncharacterized protein n=1 Tax=Candidatus Uhrbacteria bacterium RIFOXYB2_FULL_57_15 TaxID=1802422 RepID=A0A1F7W883_9BACT|nr:MAG: hypothetical protein A2348_02975 [Candidatus Uhrbacteria bacterium RIFOXYB12_FULL_58_10]OGL98427.1 MAG: hypothetical protein A2304_01910 [Candidatus Uhrbacteria bacterium RIFOXYB2_FULL_57_15]OGL99665.1 MAG: hypothetical protein A2501_03000 [Candidatus Uhrbacteria bacterium RIFOXYC12_FULL_57_11]